MITFRNLNDVQAEFGRVEQILAALELVVDAVDEPSSGVRRKNLNALIGVTASALQQMQVAQDAFESLFEAARAGKEDAA